jgi:26S proteasome regulatory subunit N11
LKARHFESHSTSNRDIIVSMSSYSSHYNGFIKDEEGKTAEEVLIANVGKVDPKRHLVNYSVPVCVFDSKQCVSNLQDNSVEELMSHNIVQLLGTMLSAIVF